MISHEFIDFYEKEGREIDRYTNRDFWGRRYHQKRASAIVGIIKENLEKGCSFLDVGCGTGEYLKIASRTANFLIGIDISTSYLRRTTLGTGGVANLIRVDASSLPFKDRSIDSVLCSEVIEHLQEPKKTIDEIFRVVTKNIIFTTPNHGVRRRIAEKILGNEELKKRSAQVGHINIFFINDLIQLMDHKKWKIIAKKTQYNLMPPRSIRLPTVFSPLFTIIETLFSVFFPLLGDTSILVYEKVGE